MAAPNAERRNPRTKKKPLIEPAGLDIGAEFRVMTDAMRGGYALANDLSDSEVVMMAASLIEQFMEFALLMRFRRKSVSRKLVADVFDGNGLLSTFSSRISVCAALGILDEQMHHDLRIIKSVRNAFAHSPAQLHLVDFDACLSLRLPDDEDDRPSTRDRRQRYVASCQNVVFRLSVYTTAALAEAAVLESHAAEIVAIAEQRLTEMFAEGAAKS